MEEKPRVQMMFFWVLVRWRLEIGHIFKDFFGSSCFRFSMPESRFWTRNEYEKSRGCHTLQGVITTLSNPFPKLQKIFFMSHRFRCLFQTSPEALIFL